ncbi:MAG: pyruvate kinase alpha/beta domain-containing protein, partial [Halobacteriota archaeon]
MRKEQIIYLEKPGPQNTEDVIDAVQTYIARSGLKRVVVASTTGATAVKFAAALENIAELVVVTHHTGFSQEGTQRFDAETRKKLE